MADPFFEVKYRFYEKENLKFAIKPFVAIPVRSESNFSERHLSYAITLVSQFEKGNFTFYGNTTYMVHREKLEEDEIFQSLSLDYAIKENFNVVTTLYLSRYDGWKKGGLIGIAYNTRKTEMAVGIGKLFRQDNNYSIFAGITFRFF